MSLAVEAGGVEVDEHRLVSPEDDVLRLHVPVDGADGVEHPQGLADLFDDFLGLFLRKEGSLQQKAQGIPLDELLDDQIFLPLRGHLVDGGQVGAGVFQQLFVDLRVAGEAAEDEALAGDLVSDEPDTAPGALLEHPEGVVFLPQRV